MAEEAELKHGFVPQSQFDPRCECGWKPPANVTNRAARRMSVDSHALAENLKGQMQAGVDKIAEQNYRMNGPKYLLKCDWTSPKVEAFVGPFNTSREAYEWMEQWKVEGKTEMLAYIPPGIALEQAGLK